MIATKRHDYVPIGSIQLHPMIENHRPVSQAKVAHYRDDILQNGLLEPLVVWERNPGEYFLVGGFHRLQAIGRIREAHPDYYDRVDVRVVAGELHEMRALNLKLNADRLDAKLTEYFDTVVFLNNAGWSKERVADFLDRSVSWVEEIVRFVPSMDPRLRHLLEQGKLSWTKAKAVCRAALAAPPGNEREVVNAALRALADGASQQPKRALTPRAATRRLARHAAREPAATYTVSAGDLMSLVALLTGPRAEQEQHLSRVRARFPQLLEEPPATRPSRADRPRQDDLEAAGGAS
jgi:ParB-like chromosome segregation protein Spo0J